MPANVYFRDIFAGNVMKLSLKDMSPWPVAQGLSFPTGVAVSPRGKVDVADNIPSEPGWTCETAAMHARIRLIRADSDEARTYIAARGAGMPAPPGRTLADLCASLELAADLSSAPERSFVSESRMHNAEVAAYLCGETRIPVVLGDGVAEASADDRIFALHEIHYDSPGEAERIVGGST